MNRHVETRYLKFDVRKAIAAIGYLVAETGASMYTVMKMMYLADKLHLEKYGQFISGDTYAAMKQGPVPSCTYDLIKHVRGEPQSIPGADLASQFLRYGSNHSIVLLQDPQTDELSESDHECLSKVAELHNRFGQWAVRDMSHDDAWRKVWAGVGRGSRSKPIPMLSIAEQLEDAAELVEHIKDSQPGVAAATKKTSVRSRSAEHA